MTKENTKSLLENIKKKMMKINTPKDSSGQLSFGNLDNEFEYISSVKNETKSESPNQDQQSKPEKTEDYSAITKENDFNTSNHQEQQENPVKEEVVTNDMSDISDIENDMEDLAVDFGKKREEPKLSDLSLAQDLKQHFSEQNKQKETVKPVIDPQKDDLQVSTNNVSQANNTSKEFGLDDMENVGDEMDFDIETKDEIVEQKNTPVVNSAANASSAAPNVTSSSSNLKDDDLDFDLGDDDQEDQVQAMAKSAEEEDHDIGDLDDLSDDHEIKGATIQDLGNSNKKDVIEDADDFLTEDHYSKDEVVEHDDLGKASTKSDMVFDRDNQEDVSLDISNNNFDSITKGGNYNAFAGALSKKSNDQEDIKLDLETNHEPLSLDVTTDDSDIGDVDIDLAHEDAHSNLTTTKSIKDSLLSKETIAKTSNSIKKLMNNFDSDKMSLDKNLNPPQMMTVEQLMMSMLQPKLEEWLNNNLPLLVERVVREEIAKIVPKS